MLLPSINNDQNIGRVYPKMTDDFQHESNAKLPDCVDSIKYFGQTGQLNDNSIEREYEHSPYGHIYTHCPENGEVSSSDANCQTAESEVRSLKDWLILHNDLIQQQNDDILEKERQIFILQRENEMLKERINCLEKGIPYEPEKLLNKVVENQSENTTEDSLSEDMTQDSCGPFEEESKENVELVKLHQSDDVVTCSLEVINYETNHVSDVESQVDTTIDEDNFAVEESDLKSDDYIANLSDSFKTESDTAECNNSLSEYNFTVDNFSEFDPMKNIKMSIRRKRVCSSSSVLSNNESTLLGEKKTFKRIKKKRRRLTKDSQIVTSKEPYVTHAIDENIIEPEVKELPTTTTLEVPRWRIRHYSSCYTMEGTENLDDEVYNKRHMRLEIDERRRKRWDVQRIREQRVIEKLKQRQDRIGSGSKGEDSQELLNSVWPKLEDIKYLEVGEELPVSAFGHALCKITPNNFSLPWLNNPSVLTRRANSKRSTLRRRKNSKNRR